jgi:hypothetical protein
MKYGKRRIVEECEVVTERSPGPRLAAVYATQGTKPLFGYTPFKGFFIEPVSRRRSFD